MEFVSVTALQEPILIQPNVFAKAAHPTASVASQTPSVMLVMLDSTSKMEFVLPQVSTAHLDNIDTMVYATAPVQLELVFKQTSVKEPAPLELIHSTTDVTEHAQQNTPQVKLA